MRVQRGEQFFEVTGASLRGALRHLVGIELPARTGTRSRMKPDFVAARRLAVNVLKADGARWPEIMAVVGGSAHSLFRCAPSRLMPPWARLRYGKPLEPAAEHMAERLRERLYSAPGVAPSIDDPLSAAATMLADLSADLVAFQRRLNEARALLHSAPHARKDL